MKAQTTAIEIVGKGTRKSDGAVVYGAKSASIPNRVYLLVWDGAAQGWTCECPRFAYRHSCKHVDALNVRIATEVAARRVLVAAKRPRSTATHEAPNPRSPQAFSLLK